VGKPSVHREKYILAALGLTKRVHIYCSRWLAIALSRPALLRSIKGTRCFSEKLSTLYNSSKIVLIIIAKPQVSKNLQSGINMRPYEILASGSLLLSDMYEELNSALVDKKNIILFDTVEQFKATLAELLKYDSLIESISSSGNQFIQGRFSYDQMAQEIIKKSQEL
jgi:spore maturation protein CgeB